jgi:prophage regulatory protein
MPENPINHVASIQEKLKQLALQTPCASYIRQKGLIPHILPFAPATLWRLVDEGRFPPPYKLSPRVTAWKIDEIVAWAAGAPKLRVHKRRAKGE